MIYCNRGCDNRMTMLANYITSFLVRYRLVEPRENEWCAYLIESRLTQMITIPFLILVGSVIAPLDRVIILNLGAPLDYHLIFGAGIYTVVYIVSRAIGKYSGAYLGASITRSPVQVKRYLGLTLLPHSGVSLVFTGIAVSVLEHAAVPYASILQGTIAAAAVINEVIAVYVAKKGFEWAGELPDTQNAVPPIQALQKTGGK